MWYVWWVQGCHIWSQSAAYWPKIGQIRDFFISNFSKSGTFSDQISVYFGSPSQNVLKFVLKKSRICPILGQTDPLLSQTRHLCTWRSFLSRGRDTFVWFPWLGDKPVLNLIPMGGNSCQPWAMSARWKVLMLSLDKITESLTTHKPMFLFFNWSNHHQAALIMFRNSFWKRDIKYHYMQMWWAQM